jgi:hypothetical protein
MPLTSDEVEAAGRAIELLADNWHEFARVVAGTLGQAYREDDARPGQVALKLLIRYGNGRGRLVRHLREHSEASPEQARQVLFSDARFICREVVDTAVRSRTVAARQVELTDNLVASADDDSRSALARADLLGLLQVGEEAWDELCDEGVLDRSEWTEDQKWTAIGMMWGFSAPLIALIRRAHGNPRATAASTYQMMTTVRRKGRTLARAAWGDEALSGLGVEDR